MFKRERGMRYSKKKPMQKSLTVGGERNLNDI